MKTVRIDPGFSDAWTATRNVHADTVTLRAEHRSGVTVRVDEDDLAALRNEVSAAAQAAGLQAYETDVHALQRIAHGTAREKGWHDRPLRTEFWAKLKPFPWMHELLSACREFAPTTLLTSPAPLPACHAGKAQWMQDTFGRDFRDYALTSVKHRFAHQGALLIDDSPKNCDAFRAHGGHAILFPGVGNELHHIAPEERVAYVREQLKGYRS